MNTRFALVLYAALGGALGTVARYLLALFIQARAGAEFPLATLVINITGSSHESVKHRTTSHETTRRKQSEFREADTDKPCPTADVQANHQSGTTDGVDQ